MMTTAERVRTYQGMPLFRMGFRPFFLFAAAWAAFAVLAWVASYIGWLPPIARDWHVHEMLFGYLSGVIAGFLLTAIPNWTGRLPVAGVPLAALFTLWAAGRLSMLIASQTVVGAFVDSAFLFVLAFIVLHEVLAGRNVKNVPVCALVFVLAVANALTHLREADPIMAGYGVDIGLAIVAMLVALIGGRITPSFTRNWMAKRALKPEPAPFGRFDRAVLAVTALALALWVAAPSAVETGIALVLSGVFNAARLARWRGWVAAGEPLVLILHLGYLWLGAALVLLGLSAAAPLPIPPTAGIHALTAGTFGVMTLAVMTRASLGHTGQALTSSLATTAIYVLINFGAAVRVASSFFPDRFEALLGVSAVAWSSAFALFVIVYGPLLLCARRQV